jgi:sarcosine oxidase subunit beta
MKATDVVVIGAGIMGASTAYYLSKAGVDVTLIERQGIIAGGTASQACAGGVRHQGRVLSEIPLAIHSIGLWNGLEKELDADLQYRQKGMTIVTDDEKLIPSLEKRVVNEQSLGLHIRMVYGSELHDLIPGLSPRMLAGSYCPLDGHANPMCSVNAFAVTAERLGARLVTHCSAEGLVTEKGKIVAVRTSKGNIPCARAILASGVWSRAIASSVGVSLPMRPFGLQMMVTVRRPHILDQVLGWLGHGISLKQVPSGGFVIGGGWPGQCDPQTYQTNLHPGSMAKSAQTTVELFPSLANIPIVRAWVGIEAFSIDELQILGPVPGLEGLVLATGFSGHGFALGPGVGELITRYITTNQLPDLLKPFGIERFNDSTREDK